MLDGADPAPGASCSVRSDLSLSSSSTCYSSQTISQRGKTRRHTGSAVGARGGGGGGGGGGGAAASTVSSSVTGVGRKGVVDAAGGGGGAPQSSSSSFSSSDSARGGTACAVVATDRAGIGGGAGAAGGGGADTASAAAAAPNPATAPTPAPIPIRELAAALPLSSSSLCFFASACRSLQVSFFPLGDGPDEGADAGEPEKAAMRSLMLGFVVDEAEDSCAVAPPGFHRLANFPGVPRLTGVYAVPTGAMRSSGAGFDGSAAEEEADAAAGVLGLTAVGAAGAVGGGGAGAGGTVSASGSSGAIGAGGAGGGVGVAAVAAVKRDCGADTEAGC